MKLRIMDEILPTVRKSCQTVCFGEELHRGVVGVAFPGEHEVICHSLPPSPRSSYALVAETTP